MSRYQDRCLAIPHLMSLTIRKWGCQWFGIRHFAWPTDFFGDGDQMTKWPTADFKKSLMPDVYCCIPSLEYLRGAFLWIILEVSSFMVDPGSSSPCVHWNSKLDDLGLRWSRSSLNWRVSATCTSGRWEIETPNPMLCFRGEKNHGSNRKSRTRPCK